jgi:radical SAM protein with 4Fe4S-binding SPASM domain
MEDSYCNSLEIQQLPMWERLKQGAAPLGFTMEVTARCNNNCRHCFINLPAGDSHATERELSLEEILSIAGQAVEMGAVWCLVTGGEPLLRAEFHDIYLSLRRKGLLVSVFTNATLIRQQHIDLLKHYPPWNLEVTVYGITRATYEAVTRLPGSFEAFRRGLDLLLENGLPVRLKAMALRSNQHELPLIAEFCRRHTKGRYRFDPLLHLRYDRNPLRNAEIEAERLPPKEIVALEQSDPERFPAMQNHCDELILAETGLVSDDHMFHCGAGVGGFSVSYDGLFRLCDSLWAPGTTYDLRRGTLRGAFAEVVPRVLDLRSLNAAFLETCSVCPIINLCLSCPAHTYLETGEMDGHTPYFCAVAHARAGMLLSGVGH